MYEAPCRAEDNADDVGTGGSAPECKSLYKTNSGTTSHRAVLCARRAELEPYKLKFRAGRWQSGGGIGGAAGGYVRSGRLHWPATLV